jgi:hypothetical protein
MKNLASVVVALGLIALLPGCSSPSYEKAGNTAVSLHKTAASIDQGSTQVDAVLAALLELVNNPAADLKPQFKKFDAAVNALQATAANVSATAKSMREKSNDYFKDWDQQLAQIKNEDIKGRSAERKTEVQQQYIAMKKDFLLAGDAFKPFMANLKDIRTALTADLTAGGLASIKDVATKANSEAVPLRAAIGKLSADFKTLGVSMSATTPAPAP